MGRRLLREWIQRAKMQDQEAAAFLGITSGYLSQLLSGSKVPSLELALKAEDLTGVSVRSWQVNELSKRRDTTKREAKKPCIANSKAI